MRLTASRLFSSTGLRKRGGWMAVATAATVVSLLLLVSTAAAAGGRQLFSSNVVALTTSNWKEHVLDNPHMVLVNICREGCGYCQRLQPEWEKLAASVKGMVTIAYWDTQGGSRPPRLLGDYQGTPTIRLFTPKRRPKKAGSVAEKTVLDYQHGERNLKDMRKFLEYQIPNYVERAKFGREDYDRFKTKAERFGLPLVVIFTTKTKTSTTLKWLSAEYRRRVLMVEVPPTDKTAGLEKEIFGDLANAAEGEPPAAALYVVPPNGGAPAKYGGDSFARRKLQDYLKEHALKEPVLEEKEKPKGDDNEKPKHDEF